MLFPLIAFWCVGKWLVGVIQPLLFKMASGIGTKRCIKNSAYWPRVPSDTRQVLEPAWCFVKKNRKVFNFYRSVKLKFMLGWRLTTEGCSYDYSKKKKEKRKRFQSFYWSAPKTLFSGFIWFLLMSLATWSCWSWDFCLLWLEFEVCLVFFVFFYCVTHKKLGWKHSGAAQQRHRWIVRAHSIRCIDSTSEKRGPWARSYGMTAAREMRAIPRRRCLCRNME